MKRKYSKPLLEALRDTYTQGVSWFSPEVSRDRLRSGPSPVRQGGPLPRLIGWTPVPSDRVDPSPSDRVDHGTPRPWNTSHTWTEPEWGPFLTLGTRGETTRPLFPSYPRMFWWKGEVPHTCGSSGRTPRPPPPQNRSTPVSESSRAPRVHGRSDVVLRTGTRGPLYQRGLVVLRILTKKYFLLQVKNTRLFWCPEKLKNIVGIALH